jgi:hypothetical protein
LVWLACSSRPIWRSTIPLARDMDPVEMSSSLEPGSRGPNSLFRRSFWL